MGFIWFPEPWCTTDELDKMWGVEIYLLEEIDGLVESRVVDPCYCYEVLRVFAGPFETKSSEIGENRTCHQRGTSAFPVRE